ncbi:MAG: M17 family peptidase N-terminal domain-containing protein, partial [Pseudomonadota bacterium]
MTPLPQISFDAEEGAELAALEGTLVVFADAQGTLAPAGAAIDGAMGGALARALADAAFKGKAGIVASLSWPSGLAARRVLLACLGAEADSAGVRRTGGAIAKGLAKGPATLCLAGAAEAEVAADLVLAVALRLYDFREYKTGAGGPAAENGENGENGSAGEEGAEEAAEPRTLRVLSDAPEALARASAPRMALAEGTYFTRDLVNEPANRLTTDEFAARLAAMQEIGLEVEIMGEAELADLGMRALLGVGQGSTSETKVVTMHWRGGEKGAAPLALVGKGVV